MKFSQKNATPKQPEIAYCYKNPVRCVDPLGLDTLSRDAPVVKDGDVYRNEDGTYTLAEPMQLDELIVEAKLMEKNNVTHTGSAKKWFRDIWNSDIARFYIPDIVYVNGSGVLAFLGGGGSDVGIALSLRGQDAGKVYLFGILKSEVGLNGEKIVNTSYLL